MTVVQNDILRIAAKMHVDETGDFVNVWHYRKTDSSPQSDTLALADAALIMDEPYNMLKSYLSERAQAVDVNAFNITQDRPLGSTVFPTFNYGTNIGDMLAAQTAVFVRGLTGYSRNWAKKYFGPFPEGTNTTYGVVYSGLMTALLDVADEWITPTAVTTGVWEPVVHRYVNNQWYPIIEVVLSNIWATIRRRRAGRGA